MKCKYFFTTFTKPVSFYPMNYFFEWFIGSSNRIKVLVIFLLKIIESRIFLFLNYYNKKGAFRFATTVMKLQYESAESQYVDLEN